jgi:hypothetical protein
MKVLSIALSGALVLGLSGCITDKMVLTNDQGQTQTCEYTGHVGIISPIVTHEKYKSCIEKAKANGFKETSPAQPAS